jgi:hypothetical protein
LFSQGKTQQKRQFMDKKSFPLLNGRSKQVFQIFSPWKNLNQSKKSHSESGQAKAKGQKVLT